MVNEVLNIYIVEDDDWYGKFLQYHISLNPENKVTLFSDGQSLLQQLSTPPDIVYLDYSLPDINVREVMDQLVETWSNTSIIIISGQEDVKMAVEMLHNGAYGYIVKNEGTQDRLWKIINNIRQNMGIKNRMEKLQNEVANKFNFSKTIIGQSAAIQDMFNYIGKAAKCNITVSITGETGTGKEVVAKAIPYNSDRKSQNFIPVNVTAAPSELMESELFHHEKGAFTGAQSTRTGLCEEANQGTLFLDETGEMDLNLQTRLLRAEELDVGKSTVSRLLKEGKV